MLEISYSNVVTYNLHCLFVMQQTELGKQVAEETLYAVVPLLKTLFSDIELNQKLKLFKDVYTKEEP